ncbi:MAG: NHL repeat-containing protein, partial [Nitrospinaceae bacterium]
MAEENKDDALTAEETSSAVELMEPAEHRPEELPQKIKVDHSKLFVWVADSGNDRIQKFDGNGKFLSTFGRSGGTRAPYNEGEFKTPGAVAVDVNNNIWVADTGCHRIQKFDPDTDFLLEFGKEGWGQEKFYWPEA